MQADTGGWVDELILEQFQVMLTTMKTKIKTNKQTNNGNNWKIPQQVLLIKSKEHIL